MYQLKGGILTKHCNLVYINYLVAVLSKIE